MTIKRNGTGWKVDIRPNGTAGKRIIRSFSTKAEAQRFEAHLIALATAGKEWNPSNSTRHKIADIVNRWDNEHGATISSGWKYARALNAFADAIGNPYINRVTPAQISTYRAERLNSIAAQTANREMTTIKSFFRWAIRHGYTDTNPAEHLSAIRTHEAERPYLSREHVKKLYRCIATHHDRDIATIAQICIETGARWSEAQNLKAENVKPDRLIFTETKSKRTRAVPIGEPLSSILMNWPRNPLFRKCEHSARSWLNETLDLPKGISTHVLRHTFASHFVMAGGNILTLQRILGHSKIEMTMRYAHLAPEHLEEAIRLNPRAQMEKMWK